MRRDDGGMSTIPSPESGEGSSPRLGPSARKDSDFFAWIRSLGVARGSDRWAGGVASGLAHRWRVDPLLVRGLFVIAAVFLGIGLLAYGILWLFLPEPDGRIHAQEVARGRWTGGTTGALIASILGLGGAPLGAWFGEARWAAPLWTLLWVGVAFLVVYGIVSSRRQRPHVAFSTSAASESPQHVSPPASPPAAPPTPAYGTGPYGTAPYGTGPYATRPGDGAPPPPVWRPAPVAKTRRPSPGGPFIAVVTGSAVLVVGVLLALQLSGAMPIDPSTGSFWAIGAVIIGVGIVVAGLRGHSAGILSLFAVIALVTAAVTEPAYSLSQAPPTSSTSSPTTIQQATEGFNVTGASAQLDLRGLDNAGALATEAVVPVNATMSSLRIEIPKGLPVRIQADGSMSNVNFGSKSASGLTINDSQTYNSGKPGATLVVTLHSTMSNVDIVQEQ